MAPAYRILVFAHSDHSAKKSDKRVVGRQCGAHSFGWAAPCHVVSCCDQTVVASVIDAIQESGHSADYAEIYGSIFS